MSKLVKYEYDVVDSQGRVLYSAPKRSFARMYKQDVTTGEYAIKDKLKIIQKKFVFESKKIVR